MLEIGMYLADRYEILSKVGAGGMSDVYKAMDHILGRFVAIKVLKQEFSEDRNFVTKFRTEAQSAAGLEHPNIVNIYDVGSEDGLHYIVMEYIEGITLKTYIEKKEQLTFKEAISIAIQVARGIEAAHNKNIIHRDIKPQNIIISTEGKVKVTDFGIARAASANTSSSDVMGSVHYASPEQAKNDFVDSRSDIYSLGIVMFEMVTGRVPFDGETTVAVALQHLQEEMPSPSTYAPGLPISLEKIILKCSQKNPDRRYQNMAELLSDLRKALVSPNEDFVVENVVIDNAKTKIISPSELEQIKEASAAPVVEAAAPAPAPAQPVQPAAPQTPEPMLTETKAEAKKYDEDDEDDEDDDEDDGILNPKLDKAVTVVGIIIAVIIVVLIIYFLGSVFDLFKFGSSQETPTPVATETESQTSTEEMVEMVNIVGMTQEEASEKLESMGLILFVSGTEESEEEEGTVLSMALASGSVSEGDMVPAGSSIYVTIAGTNLKQVEVPNVVGMTESTAISSLEDSYNLTVNKTYEYNDTIAAGEVISQEPIEGSTVTEGSTVALIISQGKQSATVPNVVGMTQDQANTTLTDAGFVVTVNSEASDTVEAGNVIRQSPAANKTVTSGTTITITVSTGKEVALYSCNYTLQVPDGALYADITLYDENNQTINTWVKKTVAGNYTISASDISTAKGTVLVTWYSEKVTAEDGTESYTILEIDGKPSTSASVTFTKQQ